MFDTFDVAVLAQQIVLHDSVDRYASGLRHRDRTGSRLGVEIGGKCIERHAGVGAPLGRKKVIVEHIDEHAAEAPIGTADSRAAAPHHRMGIGE